ncbi:MAG TPA: OmpH family outer membrane protein [Burkholderiaceae bacterium]|jgi:outer membrane protein
MPFKILILCAVCLAPLTNTLAQELKIGIVQSERIMREAPQIKAAEAKIEQEFSKRGKELEESAARIKAMSEKLDKDAAILSESDRIKRQHDLIDLDKDFQRKREIFREDLAQRKNEELSVVLERVNKVIKQIAEAEKYDLVLQEAIYFSPRLDMTDKVLKALGK